MTLAWTTRTLARISSYATADGLAMMMPNQFAIWLIHDEPFGVWWNRTCGLASGQVITSGVVWVDMCPEAWINLQVLTLRSGRTAG